MVYFLKSALLICLFITFVFSKDTAVVHDFGVHGELFDVVEEDMIAFMMRRMQHLKESGKLDDMQNGWREKAKESINRPTPVKNIHPTTVAREFIFDPSLTLTSDIVLPENIENGGTVIAKSGTVINPLHHIQLSKGFFFFDGDSKKQVQMATDRKDTHTLVLVKGNPLQLKDQIGTDVYFDQGGALTRKFTIQQVPASVDRFGDKLRVHEMKESTHD